MRLRAKLWMEVADGHVFGRGRAELLRAIERQGSISAAAARMGMSYRRAWSMLRTSEQRLGRSLVETTRGGARGGGARLTQEARELLEAFERIESRLEQLIEEQQDELDRLGV